MSKKRITWKIEKRKLADLKPHPKNPRQFTEKGMKDLENSINSIGFMQPININQDGTILSGHARTLKLQQMGEIEVDVYVPDRLLTPKQEEEVLVRANANTAGQWDFDILANEFEDFELQEWGLEIPAIETEELEAKEDDFDGEPPAEPITVLGDLYEIGEHRLLCGDSTCSDSLEKLLNNNKADLVFTEPPYRMQVEGGSNQAVGKSARKLGEAIKHLCDFDPIGFLNNISLAFNKNIMNAYIFCNKDLVPDYLNWGLENGYSFNILFWKKPNAIPLGGSHRPDVEYLLLFRKSAIWNNGLKNVNYSKCLEFGRDNSEEHPTIKPIDLISNEIQISSNKNSLVVDFFLGSGSTMVASHQLKRKCYGMELDPKYCDVIIRRMIKLDPNLKITRNGEDCKQEFIEKND
jgi:DNA modification methylase